jgi:hypothetical protein
MKGYNLAPLDKINATPLICCHLNSLLQVTSGCV